MLVDEMLNVLMRARVPLYMHRKSNHIYTAVWQHLILLAFRQYEGKSYRRFVEWLHEAYYLRMFLLLTVLLEISFRKIPDHILKLHQSIPDLTHILRE